MAALDEGSAVGEAGANFCTSTFESRRPGQAQAAAAALRPSAAMSRVHAD